jgi:hypothetical protein
VGTRGKSIAENPLFDSGKAQKKLRAYVERHQQTINIKAENILDPFYSATRLSEATDVNVLHELKDALADVVVYEWQEVEQFVAEIPDSETDR